MANLGLQGDFFVARFRFGGKEHKKSLKTTRRTDAQAALLGIERAIHALTTGLVEIPTGVDPGDFIVSGGTRRVAIKPRHRCRSLALLFEEYLANQAHKAPASLYTEKIHLQNLAKKLGSRTESPADRVTQRDLDQLLQSRLKERSAGTVHKERTTVVQFVSLRPNPVDVAIRRPRYFTMATATADILDTAS